MLVSGSGRRRAAVLPGVAMRCPPCHDRTFEDSSGVLDPSDDRSRREVGRGRFRIPTEHALGHGVTSGDEENPLARLACGLRQSQPLSTGQVPRRAAHEDQRSPQRRRSRRPAANLP